MNFIAVILMGGAGAAARYGISLLLPADGGFPASTLLVNVIGCFLLSVILSLPFVYPRIPRWLLNGLGPGFLGAFTTFSAFSTENASLLLKGKFFTVFLYVSASLLAGLAAVWTGFHVCHFLFCQENRQPTLQRTVPEDEESTVQETKQLVRERSCR